MKYNKIAIALSLSLTVNSGLVFAADEEQEQNIEKIVITGQKIDRSLKETPNSVAVLTADTFEQQNIQNVSDIYAAIPNVSGAPGTGFSIRGIDFDSVSGGGNSYLVSMYLDGAPLPYRVLQNGGTSVWDLAQVEVFRGPQSTLQGRNALAGAIMLRSTDPSYDWSGKAKVTTGQYGEQGLAIAGGGAIVDDMLAFRVAFEDTKYDGDIDNITRNEKSNYEDSQLLRAKLLFEPSENFNALLTATNTVNEQGPRWVLYDEGESPYDREVDYNSDIWTKTDTLIYNLEMSWAINDELSLASITTYSDSEYGYNWDGDMQPTQIVKDQQHNRTDKTLSQELRLTYETETLQAVIGAYYSDLDVTDKTDGERFLAFSDVGLPPLAQLLTAPAEYGGFGLPAEYAALVVPLYPDIDPIILGQDLGLEQAVSTSAIYADITWSITDKLDILTGLRYDQEEQVNTSFTNYTVNNVMPNPTDVPAALSPIITGLNNHLNGLAAGASSEQPTTSADFDAVLPKLGVSYHFTEDLISSFIFQQGYRSGGVGTNIHQAEKFTYDAEYTDSYELSLRSVWLDGQLMFNSNVFYTQWTDQQVLQRLSDSTYDVETVNAGESNVKGFEIEAFYYPTNKLSITSGIGYAKSEFTEFVSNGVDLSGQSFADAPELTANIAVNYEFSDGFFSNVNLDYAGASPAYLDPKTSLGLEDGFVPENDARLLVNAQLGYEWDHFIVRLNVSNLLDEEYISRYTREADEANRGQMQLGSPRRVSLSVEAQF